MNDYSAKSAASLLAIPGPLSLIVIVALLGLVGLGLPQRASPKSQVAQSDQKPSAVSPSLESSGTISDLLREYLGLEKSEPAEESGQQVTIGIQGALSTQRVDREIDLQARFSGLENKRSAVDRLTAEADLLREKLENGHQRLKFLIATVSDPIDSHFQLKCDNTISAISRGFEAHGFVLDRYSFPWSDDLRRMRQNGKDSLPDHSSKNQPGAILFRREPNLVMVLLVGETPTAGIHKRALALALDLLAAYEQDERHQLNVKLIGPQFSGSSPSLRFALENWWSGSPGLSHDFCNLQVEIVSGSATAFRNKKLLTRNEQDGLSLNFVRACSAAASVENSRPDICGRPACG